MSLIRDVILSVDENLNNKADPGGIFAFVADALQDEALRRRYSNEDIAAVVSIEHKVRTGR